MELPINLMRKQEELPEVKVVLQRLMPGEKALPFDIHSEKAIGQRTKLGGEPDWIEDPENTICGYCQTELTFVAQIDSIDCDDPDLWKNMKGKYIFGDAGMLYVFMCFRCGEGTTFVQGH